MNIFLIKSFFNYLLKSKHKGGHGIHSPFVYQFVANVLEDKTKHAEYSKINKLRNQLKKSNKIIFVEDFGAGSKNNLSSQRIVKQIVKYSSSGNKIGELLFRMAKNYQPKSILEIGTCLGISTIYLSLANNNSKIITIEGSQQLSKVAQENFNNLERCNIQSIIGNFDTVLPSILKSNNFDFIFFDGNHTKEATIRYFEQSLPFAHNDTIFVFDDIHWSDGMEMAWQHIVNHIDTVVTIDLFYLGIVFFRKQMQKQHFIIKW